MKLGFAGGAMEVGGSCIYLRTGNAGILLDAGVRQAADRDPIPDFRMIQNMGGVDAILISHAHMDHIGTLPIISGAYPEARIYMTPMTMDLTRVLLLDSLKIMSMREEEIPIYGQAEVSAMMDRIVPLHYQAEREILPGIRAAFYPAGHIAGAACLYLQTPEGSLFYSGDFASFAQQTIEGVRIPKLRPDIVITESTYGDQLHANRQVEERRLVELVGQAVKDGRKVLIPSFALGRAQEVLLLLKSGIRNGLIPKVPVYVDGMVREICRVYRLHPTYLRGKLGRSILKGQEPFYSDEIRPVQPMEDRRALLDKPGPAVFVASSGMLSGGPSVLYAEKIASMRDGMIVITGYQDEEAPGRRLLSLMDSSQESTAADSDTPPSVSLNGHSVPVRARVERVGLSAHGDQSEILSLMSALSPKHLFLVHGDPDVMNMLAARIDMPYLRGLYVPRCGEVIEVHCGVPRKQRELAWPHTMGETGLPDRESEKRLWAFVREKYPEREWTAIQLSAIWTGTAVSADEDVRSWQSMLEESPYFEVNPFRLFLFRPVTQEEAEKAETPHELNQQEVQDLVQLRFETFAFAKAGLYAESKEIQLSFAFPDAVPESAFQTAADAFLEETGWNVVISPRVNHAAMQQLLSEAFGNRLRKYSYYEDRKTYRIQVQGSEPGDPAAVEAFQTRTGWALQLETVSPENENRQTSFSAGKSSGPMEQNQAFQYIRSACAAADVPLQKMSIRTDMEGKYIELGFISPQIGRRHAACIGDMAEHVGWRMKIGKTVMQNLVLAYAASAVQKAGLALKKGPSYMPLAGQVQIRLADRDQEKEAALAEEILENTGIACVIAE